MAEDQPAAALCLPGLGCRVVAKAASAGRVGSWAQVQMAAPLMLMLLPGVLMGGGLSPQIQKTAWTVVVGAEQALS